MQTEHRTLTWWDFVSVPWRHRTKFFTILLVGVGLTALFLRYIPRSYMSEAVLFVRRGRESVALDATATMGQTVSLTDSRTKEINSVVEVLSSRGLAEKIVDSLGVDRILARPNGTDPASAARSIGFLDAFRVERITSQLGKALSRLKGVLHPDGPPSGRELAVERIQKSLEVESTGKSSIVTVRCTGNQPELAQDILTLLLDAYRETHVRMHQADGIHEFFLVQTEELATRLQRAREHLRDTKNLALASTTEGRRIAIDNEMSRIMQEVYAAQADLSASQASIASLESATKDLPSMQTTDERMVADNAWDQMRASVYGLQLREKELLTLYAAGHPALLQIRNQVAESQKVLDEHEAMRVQTTEGVNTARQQLGVRIVDEKARAASLEAHVSTLELQRDAIARELREFNDQEMEMRRWEQQIALLEENHRQYAENLEQARIDQVLKENRISNLHLVQSPTFMPQAVLPRESVVLVTGILLSLIGALSVSFAAERLNDFMLSPEEVEQELALVVWATLPQLNKQEMSLPYFSIQQERPRDAKGNSRVAQTPAHATSG